MCSAGLWGHQAVGVSPKRRKWFRSLCAKQIGRQKLGSLHIAFMIMSHKCENPHVTLLRQHLRAVSRVFCKWQAADPAKFASTWFNLWQRLSEVPPWKRVAGPMAATQAYLLDLGVSAPSPQEWRHGSDTLRVRWDCHDASRKVWQWVYPIWENARNARITSLSGCSRLQGGVDTTVPRRLLKRRFFRKSTVVNLQALWQGAVLSESKPGWCKLCHCALDLQHVLWACPFVASKFPEPPHLRKARSSFPWPSLWLRGLVPKEATALFPSQAEFGFQVEGLWCQQQTVPGSAFVFASDASGGPGAKDPRGLCVSWAIAAYKLEKDTPVRVASVTCFPRKPLSVAQGEQRALYELFSRVDGDFDVTVDCKSATQLLRKSSPPQAGPVPWGAIWPDKSRALAVWVPSHKDASYFADRGIVEWRRQVNQDVDTLCGKRASQAFATAVKPDLRAIDQVCEDVCLHLTRKIGHILLNRKQPSFPWVLQRKSKNDGEEVVTHRGLPDKRVIPSQIFDKAKPPTAAAVPNKKTKAKTDACKPQPSLGS